MSHQTAVPTVILNIGLFDPAGECLIPDAALILGGDQIQDVGKRESVTIPLDATIIDGGGGAALPGLIDMHVHLTADSFPLFLASGVTTVKDVGNELDRVARWSAEEKAGRLVAPRIFFCGPPLEGDPPMWKSHTLGLGGSASVRAAVAHLAQNGASAIKLYMRITVELMSEAISSAHAYGLPVTAHLGEVRAKEAIYLGLDGLEHVAQGLYSEVVDEDLRLQANDRLTMGQSAFWSQFLKGWARADLKGDSARRIIELLVTSETFLVPTLVANGYKTDEAAKDTIADCIEGLPGSFWENWTEFIDWFTHGWGPTDYAHARQAAEKMQEFIGAFHTAGGTVVAGTDTPIPLVSPGRSLHDELELLVNCGLSPGAALKSATSDAARALRQEAKLGTIEPGKFADFVIVDGDPTLNINAIRKVRTVFKAGEIVHGSGGDSHKSRPKGER